jgi:hypothetical protein
VSRDGEGESVLAGKTPEVGVIVTVPALTAETPEEEPTESSEPGAEPTTPPSDVIEREISPEDEVPTNGYVWDLVSIGRFSVEIPGGRPVADRWNGLGESVSSAPNLRLVTVDGASMIVNPRNDTYGMSLRTAFY